MNPALPYRMAFALVCLAVLAFLAACGGGDERTFSQQCFTRECTREVPCATWSSSDPACK